jgi:uncharacterized membrane protein YraQ (UPF0718 family)
MAILLTITLAMLVVSLLNDRDKTILGIKKGLGMFLNIFPTIFNVLLLVSIFLFLIPNEIIIKWLGKDSGILGIGIAAVLGSVALIPAFISYPLAAVLLKSGVSYQVTAIFITTLMMVGILTLPIEVKYFGLRVSILRNFLSFVGAIIVGLIIGLLI